MICPTCERGIYGRLLEQDLHEFIPYLTAGLIIRQYLTSSITDGAHVFVNSEGYIRDVDHVSRRHASWTAAGLGGRFQHPIHHLVEIVRRPLVSARPAAIQSYVAALVVLAFRVAAAADIITYYRRRIVFVL